MISRSARTVLLAALATLFLVGCVAVDGDIANTPTVYVDEPVNRAFLPEIYIEPENPPMAPLRAVFFPLKLRQQFSNGRPLAEELSSVFWKEWLRMKVFPGLAFARGETWRGPDQAMAMLHGADADLIVGGEITHLMFGGSAGTTQISINLEVYDASTGSLLWSMAHAGEMRVGLSRDYVLVTKKSRLPAGPIGAIMQALASDMGSPIRRWNFGQPEPDEEEASPLE